MDEARFWSSTPYMINLQLKAAKHRDDVALNRNMQLAWNVAALSRQQKLQPLDMLLIRTGPPPPQQTGDQMLAIAKQWAAATGGRTGRRKPKRGDRRKKRKAA